MSVPQPKITRLPAQNGPRIRSVAAAPSLANNARLASCLGLVCNMLPSVTAGLVKCVAAGDGGHDGSATWPPGVGVDNDVATLSERLQAGVEPQLIVQAADASTVLLGRRVVHTTHTEALLVLKLAAPPNFMHGI